MKLHKLILVTCAIMLIIPFTSAALFPDIPPVSDGQLWQPIDKFKEFHFSSYMRSGDELRCFIIYKNQYDGYKCEQVSIKEYYHMNVTESCRC